MTNMNPKKILVPNLAICIVMDLIGMASYFLPFLGEFSDIVWAPYFRIHFYILFGGRFGLIGGVLDFLEEIIPFTDIIPSFTIGWYIEKTGRNID
ncbi:MAG: hypothetical protein WDM90_15430 [Ferruginibacter sp.]